MNEHQIPRQKKQGSLLQVLLTLYLLIMTGIQPLAFHHGYTDIGSVKLYLFYGSAALLLPVLVRMARDLFAGPVARRRHKRGESRRRPKAESFLTGRVGKVWQELSRAEKLLLAFWALAGLATLTSAYRYEAFWGNEGRCAGFFTITIDLLILFTLGRRYRVSIWAWRIALAAGCLVLTFGLADFFELDLFGIKQGLGTNLYNYTSTIGNANFYSAYGGMLSAVFCSFFVFTEDRKQALLHYLFMVWSFVCLAVCRSDNCFIAWGILLLLMPFALFQTRRGLRRYGVMGTTLLTVLLLVGRIRWHFRRTIPALDGIMGFVWDKQNLLFLLCLACWAVTAALYLWDYRTGREDAEGYGWLLRIWHIVIPGGAALLAILLAAGNLFGLAEHMGFLANYIRLDDAWGNARGYVWRVCLEDYMALPFWRKLIGYGPDTFAVYSYFHHLKDSVEIYGRMYDSVHNEYLQYLFTNGALGVTAYLAGLIAMIRVLIAPADPRDGIRGRKYSLLRRSAGYAVLAYTAQAVVNINQAASGPFLWIWMGLGMSALRAGKAKTSKKN